MEKGLEHLFIGDNTSSSYHFFNKTIFEQYLLKNEIEKKLQNFPPCFLATLG